VLTGKDAGPMLEQIRLDAPDLAVVRIPTSRPDLITLLGGVCVEAIFGDCLLTYSRDNLTVGPPGPLRNKLILRTATESDFELSDLMTERIFATYRNHYCNNPQLGDFKLVRGYQEWTRLHITTPGRQCLVGYLDNRPCAYATIRTDEKESEIVLNGVIPEFRGMGIYRDLVRAVVALFMGENSPETIVSTQVENAAVQRVWVTEGFLLSRSYYTIHLNTVPAKGK
jgi:ribosomal protein S18 acetylase RimI-like enzyme